MHENRIRWKLRMHSSGGNVWTTVKCRNENYYFLGLAICIPLAFFEAIEPVLLFHFPLLQNEWNVLLSNKSTLWIKFSQGTLAVCVLLWIPGKDTGALDLTQDNRYSDAQITACPNQQDLPPPSHLHLEKRHINQGFVDLRWHIYLPLLNNK